MVAKISVLKLALGALIATAAFVAAPRAVATVVFSDNFATSSLNPVSYPAITATSTGYDIASTKSTAGTAIASNSLKVTMAGTTSGFTEAQARFTTTPVALATVGDSVELTLTFTNTNILAASAGSGTAAYLYMGLYNSGGSNPVSGLQSSGLTNTAGSSFATGGVQLWQGFATRTAFTGGSNQNITRPQQSGAGTSSANQELLANNVGGGAYNNPAGVAIGGSGASTLSLTSGNQYTLDLTLTLTATGVQISNKVFNGVGTGGTLLSDRTTTATGATLLTQSFDGLAFGWRHSGTSNPTTMDVSSIVVSSNLAAVPETSAFAATGLAALTTLLIRRRKAQMG